MDVEWFSDLGKVVDAFNVSRESSARLERYVRSLDLWRRRINLIGPSEFDRIWHRHIADCLQLVDHIMPTHRLIVDIGSGAGLPGLILALVLKDQDHEIHLIESNGKKAAFLRSIVVAEGLKATVHLQRIESFRCDALSRAPDLVTARALAKVCDLLELSSGWVDRNTEYLLLKGQDVDIELTESTKYWNMSHEKFPSRTDSTGSILKLRDVSHVDISGPVA